MGWVRNRILSIMLVVSLALPLTVSTPVEVFASQDYLSITLADIIIAWYNASGVAIGDTDIADAIYSAYSGITLADLVDHDCLTALDAVYAPGSDEMRAYVKELIGYGNLTVPMIYVRVPKLQQYLGELPASNIAKESLEAMFGWEGNLWNEAMFGLLGGVIGSVANTGKLAYNFAVNTLTEISDTVKNSLLGKTLLDIYRHFTRSNYFQDLLTEGITIPVSPTPTPVGSIICNFTAGDYDGVGGMGYKDNRGGYRNYCLRLPEHVFGYMDDVSTGVSFYVYNNTSSGKYFEYAGGYKGGDGNLSATGSWTRTYVEANSVKLLFGGGTRTISERYVGGYAIKDSGSVEMDNIPAIKIYCQEHDPWGSGNTVTGVTKYINNAVGNILSDNYLNLSPNIGNDEYMYIFDRPTYIETLNQITNNTDNGDYIDNSTIINNYNTEYVQPPDIVPARPTSAPAPTGQPVQPTVSPRPTQVPEEVSNIIYEGGISEEITQKFPFCIPWDIKAMIDRLWAPDRRAPYIHWDATFGSWGKLGEVDIDLSDFDNAAAIFRSTTLLLWIVGLVIITKHLIG